MTDEREYATAELLTFDVQDVQLPVLGKWVRVRPITNEEGTRLQYLPNLVGFSERASEFEAKALPKEREGQLAVENQQYQNHVAHLGVFAGEKPGEPTDCAECGFAHPPSLWSVVQCSLLKDLDLGMIVAAALQLKSLEALRPFSEAETRPSTRSRAARSASTPQQTS
jgi:hypothetical protein